jgi:transposase
VKSGQKKELVHMAKPRKTYDRSFKLNAVELSYQRENIKELAEELGIRVELLYRWRAEFASRPEASFPGNGKAARNEEEKEIDRLKRELAEMRLERDILKKAIGIFSKSDGRSFNS